MAAPAWGSSRVAAAVALALCGAVGALGLATPLFAIGVTTAPFAVVAGYVVAGILVSQPPLAALLLGVILGASTSLAGVILYIGLGILLSNQAVERGPLAVILFTIVAGVSLWLIVLIPAAVLGAAWAAITRKLVHVSG